MKLKHFLKHIFKFIYSVTGVCVWSVSGLLARLQNFHIILQINRLPKATYQTR